MKGIALLVVLVLAFATGCGDDSCDISPYPAGDVEGRSTPLGATSEEARAGRVTAADPSNPAIRWRGQSPVQVKATGGFVVIAAYAQRALDPVHPGKVPFGVTNPIFVTP